MFFHFKAEKVPRREGRIVCGNLDFWTKRLYIMTSSFKREVLRLLKKLHNRNISGDYAMKFHLFLPPVLLALSGCHSDLFYQEQAVESARNYIYKNARELTAEQFAFVRLTPPVILTGPIMSRNEKNAVKDSLAGGEKMQICITWRIPEAGTDYLVFGMSEPDMAYWRPLKLIRRRLGKVDAKARRVMTTAREYAVSALYEQLSAADLNTVRFTHPELLETSFPLAKDGDTAQAVRPWKKSTLSEAEAKKGKQLTLVWCISNNRCVYFCGVGSEDLALWKLQSAGVADNAEMTKMTVKKLKSTERFLFPEVKEPAAAASKNSPKAPATEKPAAGGKKI